MTEILPAPMPERTRARDDEWMLDAACRYDDPRAYDETFDDKPPRGVSCGWCPVRVTCLNFALAHRFDGVWGGTNVKQRQNFTRRQRRARCPAEECGGREIQRGGRSDTCISCGLSWPALPASK